MKKLLGASVFALAFCAVLFAQNNQSTSCPKITVDGPSFVPRPGDTITFTASVKGMDETNLIYDWTIDAGEIITGQGTSVITVRLSKDSTCPTATVEVKGFPEGCPNGDSETICGNPPPEATKIDEFGKATNGYVKMRFDSFMIQLQNDPTAQGYILNFGSDKEIAKRERQIRGAIAFRKYDASRITIVRGGAREELIKTQFWIVPVGATPPTVPENEPQAISCPKITITGPPMPPKPGETVIFTANVKGLDLNGLIYYWSISDGKILSGQGTRVIKVRAASDVMDRNLTASVEIKNFPKGCDNFAADTAPVARLESAPLLRAGFFITYENPSRNR